MKIKQTITKTHFVLLVFILLNFAFKFFLDFSLNYSLAFVVKIIIYLTGTILFFLNLKPFRKVALYFSFFAWTSLVAAFFWLFHGIFIGILSSIFLFPVFPNDIQYKKDNLKVYTKFQGFLGACCTYEITEQKFFLFEKHLGEIKHEDIDFKNFDMKVENDSIKMKFEENSYDYGRNQEIKYDTIIRLKIK
jgi:hypothetical protein